MDNTTGNRQAGVWTLACLLSIDHGTPALKRNLAEIVRLTDAMQSAIGDVEKAINQADDSCTSGNAVSPRASATTDALRRATDFFDWAAAALEEAAQLLTVPTRSKDRPAIGIF